MMKKRKPVIEGGEPIIEKYIPYGHQTLDKTDIELVVDTLKEDFITQGPKIKELEEKLARYLGVKFVVLVSNGTAALHSAAYAAGVAKGDDVLVSDMSFVASANCALYQGANPILVDIDEKTGNIDVKDMERRLTKNTKAVVVVDYAGQPVDHDEIDSFCQKNNLILIEDAAHAIGATYRSKKVGTLSTLTTFSFHPVKNITTGEGGAVATNKPALYE